MVSAETVKFCVINFKNRLKERKSIYIAPFFYACIVSKSSDMDHAVLPENTPFLPFFRKRSLDGATPRYVLV